MRHLSRQLCVGALVLVTSHPVWADDYQVAFLRAGELESSGQLDQAAATLHALEAQYRDDFDLFMQLGWLHYRLGAWDRSVAAYRRASQVSGGQIEARVGLAWALLRGGEHGAARREFEQLPTGDERVRSGLAAAAAVSFTAEASGGAVISDNHPYVPWSYGISSKLSAQFYDSWFVAGRYRYTEFGLTAALTGLDQTTSFEQHELFLTAGYAKPRWGVAAHYARVFANDSYGLSAHVVGATARYSAWGDVTAQVSASLYDGTEAYRSQVAWAMPVYAQTLYLVPALSGQVVAGEAIGTLGLSSRLVLDPVTTWIGGRFGQEQRNVDLFDGVIWNTPDTIRGAVGGGVAAELTDWASLSATYEWQRREVETDDAVVDAVVDADAHVMNIRLMGSF